MNFFWIFSPLRKLGKDIFTALETWQRMNYGPTPARFAPPLVAEASGTRRIARRNPRPTRARALDPGRRDDSQELEGAYHAELFLFEVKLGTRHRGQRLRPRQPPSTVHLSGTALCLIHIETMGKVATRSSGSSRCHTTDCRHFAEVGLASASAIGPSIHVSL
jgi:hypothetical protein